MYLDRPDVLAAAALATLASLVSDQIRICDTIHPTDGARLFLPPAKPSYPCALSSELPRDRPRAVGVPESAVHGPLRQWLCRRFFAACHFQLRECQHTECTEVHHLVAGCAW